MNALLTPYLLRRAAAWLSINRQHHRLEFMCHALYDAVAAERPDLNPAIVLEEFNDLLDLQDVGRGGLLLHRGHDYYFDSTMSIFEVQALRFDFLHLLALELEGDWDPAFSPWRHGGWYVTNVHYPSGAVGCVSRNYPDKRWRIVCDDRNHGDLDTHVTFKSRDAAARAERDLASKLGDEVDLPQELA